MYRSSSHASGHSHPASTSASPLRARKAAGSRTRRGLLTRRLQLITAASALSLPLGMLLPVSIAGAAVAPVGQGFTVTPSDLAFILKQIKIAERHAATLTPTNPCGTLVGSGPNQIPDRLTSYGLRTVDGSCNNLYAGRETFGAADVQFPRLTTPVFRDAEPITASFPVGPPGPTSYKQKKGSVVDSHPRVISNLIVDQTSTNPAAIAAAGYPIRTQGNPGQFPCTTDPDPTADPPVAESPPGCVPSHHTLFIPNVTTDVGLSPPFNSLFTFFGQFFDHGVDQTVKSGGTVFVPLRDDDPLIAGPDHVRGTADDLPPQLRFMVLTRAQNQPGPDGILGDRSPTSNPPTACTSLNNPAGCDESLDDIQNATNTDSPWVDQSQTYTSHSSHQVFLREYVSNASGVPVSTGKLLGGLAAGQTYSGSPDGRSGIGTWKAVKLQAENLLGLHLVDMDALNVPMIAADPYGTFIPGPVRGLPQYVTTSGLVEGDLANPVPVPANVIHFDTPFLTDIAHNADPSPVDTDHNPSTPPVAPSPDSDNTPSADFANQPAGTYDDEMLDAHFACGDGRCNENIALSAVHQIFHSEHDRLVDDIKSTLLNDTSSSGVAALPDWQLPVTSNPDGWNGERLFQAARFVTEMEYQHLVFEEFARKIQPAIRPFHVYHPDINPAVKAEFAHAVYRFGHSMLDDDVARKNMDGSDNSLPLLTAFLNPPEFFNGHGAGTLTPEQAAGSIFMGSSDQIGNEIDEFVTETLRNNLLGLPLDLPTINMTRAREAGIPPLNQLRRDIFAQTNDGQLAPYTSWSDFGQHLKHPESLINFVAAYGTHPTILTDAGPDATLGTGDDGPPTLASRRNAARAIVNPNSTDVQPADAASFMYGTDAWADVNGETTTGLESVDLWVGGLAEITNLFGGLLGSTFNYVFQSQLEALQDGDRLYYLARTPGLNLRAQLEGNTFAEMIQRNTDGTNTLKSDAFATADCKFQLANLAGTPQGYQDFGSTVADDPTTTDCDESQLLLRKPDGTIQYRQYNSVDPSGINGQSVYNGTPGVDRIYGGNDNDTFWGGAGNDVIEGNGGDDNSLGGEGDDRITDLAGDDVEKGGPGNDALDGGIGNDLLLGGDGSDFLNGGQNDNESFGGPGNDFIIAGAGADAVFGDGGDDWIEGGSGQDLLQGDHGAPFFDDPGQVAPGNDIFIGQVGENDYDAEGGDDVMSQNAAIDRNAGAAGFDWAFHQYDTVGADDDMEINNNLVGVPIQVVVNRDRWQETEADSGSSFDDVIKGTSVAPATIGGAGFSGCDVLDAAGLARISGLAQLLPTLTGDPAAVISASASGFCPVIGPIWGDGDILLGGLGSDTITGRGADDIIDGDRALAVRISVRTDPANPATEIGSTDLMEAKARTGSFGPGTSGMTLQQAVFAGLVNPAQLVGVREILTPLVGPADCGSSSPTNCDTAVFAGPRSNYSITSVAGIGTTLAKLVVTQTGANVVGQKISDGVDNLRNIEQLRFSDQTVLIAPPDAPTIGTATAGSNSATVTWTAPTTGAAWDSFDIVVNSGGSLVQTVTGLSRTATSGLVTGLANGTSYTFQVRAVNPFGTSPLSAESNAVTPAADPPEAPTIGSATAGNSAATVTWTTPASNGGAAITGFSVRVVDSANNQVGALRSAAANATSLVVTGLTCGQSFRFQVAAINSSGTGAFSALSNAVTPYAVAPAAPSIGTAIAGNSSATAVWSPASDGGAAISGYAVRVVNAAGKQVGALRPAPASATSLVVTGLTNGETYRFQVSATNSVGKSPLSALSNAVTPATVPGAPVIGTPKQGAQGGALTAIATWNAPSSNGGAAISSYRVVAVQVASDGTPTGSTFFATVAGTARSAEMTLPAGSYKFQVVAINRVGESPPSALSKIVVPR